MENMSNYNKRDGVLPVGLQAGRVPSPEPRMDSPLATGRQPPHRRQDASCSSKRSTFSSGKTNETSFKSHNSASGSENGERNGIKPNLTTLNCVHFNICGLSTKKDEFKQFLYENKIQIALLQETQHVADTDLKISGYTHYPCDCKNCQGAITYIRNDVTGKVTNINTTQPTILQKAEIWHTGCKYTIYNVYNPPEITMNLIPHFGNTQYSKTIIAGDFNGRSPSWGYRSRNATGKFIETFCNTTNLFRIQDNDTTPTHFHRAHKTLNRPDLTLISADLIPKIKTEVKDGIGTSDHFPTMVYLETQEKKKVKKWTRWNFKKAQWGNYKETSDRLLSEVQLDEPDLNNLTQKVNEAILTAAHQCIPRGCRAKYKPFWNETIADSVQKRETARKKYMENNSTENRIEYNRSSAISKRQILSAKRQKFQKTCEDIDLSKEVTKAWCLLKNLNGENKKNKSQASK